MKTQKPTLALLAATLLLPALLHADSLTVYGDLPSAFTFRPDGTLVSKGVVGTGALQPGEQGEGTRMLWYPGKGAFRAGEAGWSGAWNDANIGAYSVAFGEDTTASGYASTALGWYTSASGWLSLAAGVDAWATGAYSIAIGNGVGAYATASVAIGNGASATGVLSMALGTGVTASGMCSVATGNGTTASAYNSFVIGSYNVGGGNATTWVGTDPLFEVGNGSWETGPSSALIVYKNGDIKIPKPQGDIPMGEFQ